MKKDLVYRTPQACWRELAPAGLVCTSPGAGETEDVGYEDLVIQ